MLTKQCLKQRENSLSKETENMEKPMEISEMKTYRAPIDGLGNKINDLGETRNCPISKEEIDLK